MLLGLALVRLSALEDSAVGREVEASAEGTSVRSLLTDTFGAGAVGPEPVQGGQQVTRAEASTSLIRLKHGSVALQ